ncbi:predicted protein [Chaetoceros tenuissimus]|uniref:Transmembrane protein n=1 Tax=Chaetoceros tenuissimus TaxID=426638 RepID=A0AAD3H5P0_9STRA|nr:predicted protein [Chaetoceros tenuissimus]
MYSTDVNSESNYGDHVEEDVDTDVRNGGNRELKQIENKYKLESIEGALLEMKQMESMREMKLKEHNQKLLDEMEKKRELEMKKHEQMLLDEMQRMKESEASMMKYQMAMLFGGCLFASFATIQMMRRQNN